MNLERVLRRTRKYMEERRTNDREQILHTIGASIGNELPRNRLWLLKEARAGFARIHIDDEYGRGYKDAVQDILFSYELAVENNIRNMIEDPDAKYETNI